MFFKILVLKLVAFMLVLVLCSSLGYFAAWMFLSIIPGKLNGFDFFLVSLFFLFEGLNTYRNYNRNHLILHLFFAPCIWLGAGYFISNYFNLSTYLLAKLTIYFMGISYIGYYLGEKLNARTKTVQ